MLNRAVPQLTKQLRGQSENKWTYNRTPSLYVPTRSRKSNLALYCRNLPVATNAFSDKEIGGGGGTVESQSALRVIDHSSTHERGGGECSLYSTTH